MVTVKADAYGHGLIKVSRKLIGSGVDFLGVASIDEGIRLRQAHIKLPILVLGMILKEDIDPAFKYGLSVTVCEMESARYFSRRGRQNSKVLPVHIKVDTGMGRIGVMHYDARELVRQIAKLKNLKIEGLFTHFPFADMNQEFTLHQIELFNQLAAELKKTGPEIPFIHAANSMGVIGFKDSHFNMVRPGLVIYGLYPRLDIGIRLKPALSLKTRVVFIKKLPKGSGVSYGHDYIAPRDTRIATLPIGYGDGYPRILSGRAPVLIGGKHFQVAGRICMDQTMVDVGDAPVKIGDEVVLIGSQKNAKITTEELAGLSQTIPYEIVCGLGSRIPRVYID